VVGILTILHAVLCEDEPTSSSFTTGLCNTSDVGLLHLGLYYLIATSVNLVATTLICVRLVRMKHLVNKLSASSPIENPGESPYSRVTAILLESALPFTLLGILSSVVAFVDTSGAKDARIFAGRMWTIASVSGIIACPYNRPPNHCFPALFLQGLTAQVITYRVITGVSFTSASPGETDTGAISHPIRFTHSALLSRSGSGVTLHDLP
jgi:hypothetical protein